MRTNLRSLVAKAYRVRQGRTFSSAPNPIDKGGYLLVRILLSRGVVTLSGFGVAYYTAGDRVSKFDEELKAIDKEVVEFLEKRGKLPPGYH